MGKQIVIYLHNGIQLSIEKEQTAHNNMDESQMHFPKWENMILFIGCPRKGKLNRNRKQISEIVSGR